MHLLVRLLVLPLALAAFPALTTEYPFWDGEPIEEYAEKVGLPPTKTLDLGNDVTMEFVLIPAGKFRMGTPEPESLWIGATISGIVGLTTLVLLAVLVIGAIRQRRRVQFSLRWLVVLVALLGLAQYGGWRCWRAVEARKRFEFLRSPGESPAHEVTISAPYFLGKFEVTQEQYQQVSENNPSESKGCDLPVERVPWDEAQEFCKKVSEHTGFVIRLPTEAEWEYACRAGSSTTYCAGDSESELDGVAWHNQNSGGKTHPVGSKAPNTWDAYDMHGNVWEWCSDWYGDYGVEAVTDPQGPTEGQWRVLRGGAWSFLPMSIGSARRWADSANGRFFDVGFRVVGAVPSAR